MVSVTNCKIQQYFPRFSPNPIIELAIVHKSSDTTDDILSDREIVSMFSRIHRIPNCDASRRNRIDDRGKASKSKRVIKIKENKIFHVEIRECACA